MEVETDKATVEVPSPISGRIVELLFKEGDEITTGSNIVICES
jgi:pyruvate dehydrogenase E2 component (dihydrolipoamide acetyltransferase)